MKRLLLTAVLVTLALIVCLSVANAAVRRVLAESDVHDVADVLAGSGIPDEDAHDVDALLPEFNLGEPVRGWDAYRRKWAAAHPEVKQERIFMITGTQPRPCKNPEGDHLLLRCFKNKVDYTRLHGIGLFYNMALLDPNLPSFWAKTPIVRTTMLAHPEVEWIWWLDSDAIITDMDFEIPLERYDGKYHMIVHGWEGQVYDKKSWVGLNAGSFLIRNCQWSMDMMERWAGMGPKSPMGDAYRNILSDLLPDRPRDPTDDQAAFVYLINQEKERWGSKLKIELDFYLSGYWVDHVDSFEKTEEAYREQVDKPLGDKLRRLLEPYLGVGKEKLAPAAAAEREKQLASAGFNAYNRRPFITHFTGCQPCSGNHNPAYPGDSCRDGLVRALNAGDDQVLRTLGYKHPGLLLPDVVPTDVV